MRPLPYAGTVSIDVACNDPDNGLFAGRAEMITVCGDLLELCSQSWRPPRFAVTPAGFRLSGKNWRVLRSKDWVGNWSWNRYVLDLTEAVRFLDWLHGRGLFSVDAGEERMAHLWDVDRPFTDHDHEFLGRQMVKAQLAAAA